LNNPAALISTVFIAALICAFFPRRARPFFALAASILALAGAYALFRMRPASWGLFGYTEAFRIDALSGFVALFIALFGALVILYSVAFMKGKAGADNYYPYILATIGASLGAVLSNNLLLFISFWGFLGLTLYLLIAIGGPEAKGAAKKTFIIIGGTDALMMLGLAVIWKLTGSMRMDGPPVPLDNGFAIYAFVLLALGAFAKAGAMPLHTWIPDSAEHAPVPVMALLPASVDKLLGIYFLARLSFDIFAVKPHSGVSLFLLIVGSVTIIAAVMMAIFQHNMKRLLSYHAVSQVGYMVLGIGTANPVGIAGGLFHMLNNAIYKSALFFTAGAVEKETGTTDLDGLGGMARFMPVSFLCCLIASLAISGVPPFNGFASKWMVYQGIVELGSGGDRLWVLWLAAAMFGSALTMASFMKLLHAVFLGQRDAEEGGRVKEVPVSMWLPMAALAGLCVVFGVFAFRLPLKYFIIPSVDGAVSYAGLWQPGAATVLILAGLALGALIYYLGSVKNARVAEPFAGGAAFSAAERPRGTAFYDTISDIPVLGAIYRKAGEGLFDVYELAKKATFGFSGVLRHLHNGVLPTYLVWCLIGMLILFVALLRFIL